MSDDVISEFGDDGSLDELDELIGHLASRTDKILFDKEFSSIELSGARANIALLRTIIREHGGNHLITKAKVSEWQSRMLEVFTNPEMWGFAGSDPEENARWAAGCKETASELIKLLEE